MTKNKEKNNGLHEYCNCDPKLIKAHCSQHHWIGQHYCVKVKGTEDLSEDKKELKP